MTSWFEPGHVAIVTGGSRGLGKETARLLLENGVRVVIDGRDADILETARRELSAFGEITAIAGDVSEGDHAHALVAAARAFGRLDLLVNNASTLGEVPLPAVEQLTHQTFRRLFDINVFAPIHLMQHALRLMRKGGGIATIVNVTSDAAVEAYPAWGGYGSSKAALEHISAVLAAELTDERIRVLVVDPGDMNTQMHRDAIPGADPADLRDPAESARALLRVVAEMRTRYERVRLAELVNA